MLGDERELAGKTIVDVGDLTNETKRVEGAYRYDPITRKNVYESGRRIAWREFHGRSGTYCFDDPLGYGAIGKKAAMLLAEGSPAGSDRVQYLAILDPGVGTVGVKIERVLPIPCPSRF
jgi:hypothetical protein